MLSFCSIGARRGLATILIAGGLHPALLGQASNPHPGIPFRLVVIREEHAATGIRGHLELDGREIAKTFEPGGETIDPTTSRMTLRYTPGAANASETFFLTLDDVKNESGNPVELRMGGADAGSTGVIILGVSWAETVVRADTTTPEGQQLLEGIQEQEGIGKDVRHNQNGHVLEVTGPALLESKTAADRLRIALYGTDGNKAEALRGILEIRSTRDYRQEDLAMRTYTAEQLRKDEQTLRSEEAPATATQDATPATTSKAGAQPNQSGQPQQPMEALPRDSAKHKDKDKKKAAKPEEQPEQPAPAPPKVNEEKPHQITFLLPATSRHRSC